MALDPPAARRRARPKRASLIRALARTWPWRGIRSAGLRHGGALDRAAAGRRCRLSRGVWRSKGDTVERLEILAQRLVAGESTPDRRWPRNRAVLDYIASDLRPRLAGLRARRRSTGLLAGLDGRFVAPGPSGAPTRGRPDVLPTGRNFYSVDTRAVPTPAAWQLGLEIGRAAARALSPGAWQLAEEPGAQRLGHRQHAHRRRRYRPGAGADGRAADAGTRIRARSPASRSCRSRSSTARAST